MSDETALSRRRPDPWELGFGLVVVALGAVALLVWFPNDIRGGMVERSPAGRAAPGDAFFPVALVVAMMALGAAQVVRALMGGGVAAPTARLDAGNLRFVLGFVALFAGSMAIMRWSGPLAAHLLDTRPYRALSDTPPWKYLGYAFGGLWLGYGSILWMERRARIKPLLAILLTLVILAVIFDVLLGTVRLPPNADV